MPARPRLSGRPGAAIVAATGVVVLAVGASAAVRGSDVRPVPTARTTGTRTTAARPATPLARPSAPNRTAAARPTATAPAARPSAAAPAPRVAPLRRLVEADLLVTSTTPLTRRAVAAVGATTGVRDTLAGAVGPVGLGRARVTVLAADPGHLRAWVPALTARSDPLWASLARGEAAASFDAGHNLSLTLGGPLALRPQAAAPATVRLGALASTALPGIDAVVAPATGSRLALVPGSALLVSAPGRDLAALRDRLRAELGPKVSVVQVHSTPVVVRDAGEFLTRAQLTRVLTAAQGVLGAPYVWGATGPTTFDCSGLIGYAYAAAGVRLPRTSEQLWFAGVHVPIADARPGDLLFWAYDAAAPEDIDHVAMYVGGGMMVSAPHTGAVVHVGPVPTGSFRGVVRVDPRTAARVGGPGWAPGR